jgi:hypothetical protein
VTDRIHRYVWGEKPSALNHQPKAEDAGRELLRVEGEYGVCTPRNLVEASRPTDAPLHGAFEWDDAKAAEKWRLRQANVIIMCLNVVPQEGATPLPATAYLIVGEEGADKYGKGHVGMMSVVNDPARRREFLLKELKAVEGDLRRTEAFEEMMPLRRAAAEVRAALTDEGKAAAA